MSGRNRKVPGNTWSRGQSHALDIFIEGFIPLHKGYSFYACAAAFWTVFIPYHFADTEKAKRLFGFEALIELETGLEKTVAWLREARIAERIDAEAAGTPNW